MTCIFHNELLYVTLYCIPSINISITAHSHYQLMDSNTPSPPLRLHALLTDNITLPFHAYYSYMFDNVLVCLKLYLLIYITININAVNSKGRIP